jgi:hypothetical protein
MLSTIYNTQLTGNKSQSQVLIEPVESPTTVFKNADALANESIHSYIDDENQQQQQQQQQQQPPQQENLINDRMTEEIQATTQC